jgi:hypothetical protein
MPTADDIAFMKAYAIRGVKDWAQERGAMSDVHTRAYRLLGNGLAQSEPDAKATIDSVVGGAPRTKFIPMPNKRPREIEHCFFMPMHDRHGMAFELLILCFNGKTLGFRFEPADIDATTHCYAHVQMNRFMQGGMLAVSGLPDWVPTSYPAFPLRSSEPIEMFLSMLTAIHGYPKFMDRVLQTAPIASRQAYAARLKAAML